MEAVDELLKGAAMHGHLCPGQVLGVRMAGRQVPEPPGIRLCTAFFNPEDEVRRVAEALEGIARG